MLTARRTPQKAILVRSHCLSKHLNLLSTEEITRDLGDKQGAIRVLNSICGIIPPGDTYNATIEIVAIVRALHKVKGEYDVVHKTSDQFEDWYNTGDKTVEQDSHSPRTDSVSVVYHNTNHTSYHKSLEENHLIQQLINLQLQHGTTILPDAQAFLTLRIPYLTAQASNFLHNNTILRVAPHAILTPHRPQQDTEEVMRAELAAHKAQSQQVFNQFKTQSTDHRNKHTAFKKPNHILTHAGHRLRR